MPLEGEVAGLLALMLLTDARRAARTDPDGFPIPLAEQRHELWDRGQIDEGLALVGRTLGTGPVGRYQLQAAIADVPDEAPSGEDGRERSRAALPRAAGRPPRLKRRHLTRSRIRPVPWRSRCPLAPTSVTSRSWPTWTTARPRWSTPCCGSPGPSAPTRTSPSGCWTRPTSSARRASRSWRRTRPFATAT